MVKIFNHDPIPELSRRNHSKWICDAILKMEVGKTMLIKESEWQIKVKPNQLFCINRYRLQQKKSDKPLTKVGVISVKKPEGWYIKRIK